jgi:hypothetical protein
VKKDKEVIKIIAEIRGSLDSGFFDAFDDLLMKYEINDLVEQSTNFENTCFTDISIEIVGTWDSIEFRADMEELLVKYKMPYIFKS